MILIVDDDNVGSLGNIYCCAQAYILHRTLEYFLHLNALCILKSWQRNSNLKFDILRRRLRQLQWKVVGTAPAGGCVLLHSCVVRGHHLAVPGLGGHHLRAPPLVPAVHLVQLLALLTRVRITVRHRESLRLPSECLMSNRGTPVVVSENVVCS